MLSAHLIIIIPIAAILLTLLYGLGAIQENIWRNRKLGNDPKSQQWHFMQSLQVSSFFIAVSVAGWQYHLWIYELPLAVLYWVLFQGFNNLYTFQRHWGYVGNLVTRKSEGSQIDQWFLNRKDPEKAMKIAQVIALVLSIVPLLLHFVWRIL